MSLSKAALLLLLAAPAAAQSSISGDFWTSGTVSVGTTTAQSAARFDVRAGSATEIPFSVFSQASASDPFPAVQVEKDGRVGTGVTASTWTRLDVWGVGDVGDIGLQLRFGNYYPAISPFTQLAFGFNGSSNYRHAMRSVHLSSTARNGLDFWLWTPGAGSAADMPDLRVFSLVTTSSVSMAGVEVMPVPGNELNAQLVISNGASAGGGTLHRWAEGTPSSRALKSDIRSLGEAEELIALEDLQELKHARFRYKSWKKGKLVRDKAQPLRRGIVYEEAPASIRKGGLLIVSERVNNLELGMKALMRELDALEEQAGALK